MQAPTLSYIQEKWGNAGFQKYFRNTGWMFVSRVLSMATTFFATVYIARNLGPGNYGQLSYAVSFISLFGFIASLGIDSVLYRELISNPDKKRYFLGSSMAIKFFAGAIAMALAIGAAQLYGQNDVSKKLIIILSGTFIFSAFQVVSYEFQAQVKSKYPAIIAFIVTLALNILKVIVVVLGKGVVYLSLVLLFEPILYIFFYWFAYEKKLGEHILDLRFDRSIAVAILADSWPIIFTSAFALVYGRIDQVFIKHIMGAAEVGIYSSAVTIAETWYFLPVIIISSVFPAIINSRKNSEEVYYARLGKLSLFLLLLAIVISVVVTAFAPLIMKIVYGTAFVSGSIILQIYVWATIGTFLGYLANNYLVAENNKAGLVIMTLLPMVLNVVLNLLWIPRYGIAGSAWATLISYSLGPICILAFKDTRDKLKKYFLAAHASG